MVDGALQVAAVMIGVALLPVAVLTVLFRVIDYLGADSLPMESGSESDPAVGRDPHRAGPSVDVVDDGPTDTAVDPDHEGWEPDADETLTCPSCGVDNDVEYDRCWNCLESL